MFQVLSSFIDLMVGFVCSSSAFAMGDTSQGPQMPSGVNQEVRSAVATQSELFQALIRLRQAEDPAKVDEQVRLISILIGKGSHLHPSEFNEALWYVFTPKYQGKTKIKDPSVVEGIFQIAKDDIEAYRQLIRCCYQIPALLSELAPIKVAAIQQAFSGSFKAQAFGSTYSRIQEAMKPSFGDPTEALHRTIPIVSAFLSEPGFKATVLQNSPLKDTLHLLFEIRRSYADILIVGEKLPEAESLLRESLGELQTLEDFAGKEGEVQLASRRLADVRLLKMFGPKGSAHSKGLQEAIALYSQGGRTDLVKEIQALEPIFQDRPESAEHQSLSLAEVYAKIASLPEHRQLTVKKALTLVFSSRLHRLDPLRSVFYLEQYADLEPDLEKQIQLYEKALEVSSVSRIKHKLATAHVKRLLSLLEQKDKRAEALELTKSYLDQKPAPLILPKDSARLEAEIIFAMNSDAEALREQGLMRESNAAKEKANERRNQFEDRIYRRHRDADARMEAYREFYSILSRKVFQWNSPYVGLGNHAKTGEELQRTLSEALGLIRQQDWYSGESGITSVLEALMEESKLSPHLSLMPLTLQAVNKLKNNLRLETSQSNSRKKLSYLSGLISYVIEARAYSRAREKSLERDGGALDADQTVVARLTFMKSEIDRELAELDRADFHFPIHSPSSGSCGGYGSVASLPGGERLIHHLRQLIGPLAAPENNPDKTPPAKRRRLD